MRNMHANTEEEQRIEKLRKYNLLGLGKDAEFDVFAQAAAAISGCSVALIGVMEFDTQRFQSCIGLDVDLETLPRNATVCQYAMLEPEPIVILDTTIDIRTASNLILREAGIRFYCGIPVLDEDNLVLGTLCVMDQNPQALNKEQLEALKGLAKAIGTLYKRKWNQLESGFYQDIFKFTQDPIAILDLDLSIKEINPTFSEIFKKSKDKLIHQSFLKLFEEDQGAIKEALALCKLNGESSIRTAIKMKWGGVQLIDWNLKFHPNFEKLFVFGRDVSQQTEEQAKLSIAERKFNNFFESAIGLMSIHDLNGNILKVNRKGREMLLYDQTDVENGLNLLELVPKEHVEKCQLYLNSILTSKEMKGMMTLQTKVGEKLHFFFHNVLEYDQDGHPYVVSTALDMTERRKLEVDLRQTKQILEQTNVVAQVGGWEFDVKTGQVFWSSHAKRIYGVNFHFKPTFESSLEVFESESADILRDALDEAIRNGQSYDLELKLKRGKQESIWVRVKGIPDFDEGVCVRVFGVIQDIDQSKRLYLEVKKKEAMLQAFVKFVPASVSMYDNELNYVSVSQQWLEEFSVKESELIHRSLFEMFPDIPEKRKVLYLKALEGESYKNTNEIFVLKNSSVPQHFNWEVRPWHITDDRVGGVIIFAQNITEGVLINEELRQAKQKADWASKAKSEFLANMSHEIRTPLNGVIGFSELLIRTPLTDTQKQYLKYINESGTNLLHIINDILDFSKIESGNLELFIERSNLYELSSQVINVVLFQAQRKKLELLLNVDQGLPQHVWLDDTRLKQVLINLVGNAVKFTDSGEVELQIKLVEKSENRVQIRFLVRDTGIGIDPERQERIFKAFTQVDNSISKRYGGTGLGLTISSNLLQCMGSKLEIISKLGQGSTFYFDLEVPYEIEEGVDLDFGIISRALVLDDNQNNLLILQDLLQFRGAEAVLVKSASEVTEVLMEGKTFDLLIADYDMPLLSGDDIVDHLQELFSSSADCVPMIVLHSSAESQEAMNQNHNGCPVVNLMKPVRSEDLFVAIRTALQMQLDLKNSDVTIQEKDLGALVRSNSVLSNLQVSILVVDDNPVNQELHDRILKDLMPLAEVVQASDGAKALELCSNQVFDLVFMDVQMLVMDGLEATKNIRLLPGYLEIPIIGLSASTDIEERENCLGAGMTDFLIKPIRIVEFERILGQYLCAECKQKSEHVIESNDVFDIRVLQEHFGDDPNFKAYFLELVIQEINESLQNLIVNKEKRDVKALKQCLHKLRGTSSTIGFKKIGSLTSVLERELEDQVDLTVDFERLFLTLMVEIENALQIIINLKE